MKRWMSIGLGVVIVTGAILALMARGNRNPDADDMGPLEIGPETTRIVAPLTPGGQVDYLAALNATEPPDAADNAAIPLIRVLGTDALVGDVPVVLARLGAPQDLPPTGLFQPAPEDVVEALWSTDERHERAGNPLIARWIENNRAALDTLVNASQRPRLWLPIVRNPADESMTPALPPGVWSDLTDALATRAEITRADGHLRAAWIDLEALLRLHLLVDTLPGLISRMIAGSIHGQAMDGLKHLLGTSLPDDALSGDMLGALTNIPPPRSLAPDLDGFDRLWILDGFIQSGRAGAGNGPILGLNPALRLVNRRLDELVPLLEAPDVAQVDLGRLERLVEQRRERLADLNSELETTLGKLGHVGKMLATGGAHVSRLSGEVVATVAVLVVPFVVDHVQGRQAKRHVVALAIALRRHALRTGDFPDTLGSFSLDGRDTPYEQTETGCRVGDDDYVIELTR